MAYDQNKLRPHIYTVTFNSMRYKEYHQPPADLSADDHLGRFLANFGPKMNVCLGCKSVFTSRSILGLLSHYCEKYGENCPVIRDLEELGDHSEVILEQSFVMCKCDGVSYKCQI